MYFEITGQKQLSGNIRVSGAKNSVLALIIASTMTNEVVSLEDAPDIQDVHELIKILKYLGSNVIISNEGIKKNIIIDNSNFNNRDLLIPEVQSFRASYYFLGALLARYGRCKLLLPGGCFLGERPIDLHIKGFENLGYDVQRYNEDGKEIIEIIKNREVKESTIFLDFPSVGATINIMLAAALSSGETIMENVAKEPEIVDIATLLNNMGAKIKGAGTNELKITGVEKLNGCFHQVLPDRIEAGTYLMIGSLLSDDLVVDNIIPEHLEALISKLEDVGVKIQVGEESVRILGREKKLSASGVKIGVYPSFATDLQQIFVTLLTQTEGEGKVIETIYPDRFRNCDYLNNMGSDIDVTVGEETGKAIITGPTRLYGKDVYATDLRAGASLIFAGLIAEGNTRIYNIEHILRGYDRIIEKLQSVGAEIKIVKESNEE